MHPELKHALSVFTYAIAYIFAPFALLYGLFTGGVSGYAICGASLFILSASYVFASLPKAPVTNREALSEAIFWLLSSGSIAAGLISVLSKSWLALSVSLALGALSLLAWNLSTEKTKYRIKHAPLS